MIYDQMVREYRRKSQWREVRQQAPGYVSLGMLIATLGFMLIR